MSKAEDILLGIWGVRVRQQHARVGVRVLGPPVDKAGASTRVSRSWAKITSWAAAIVRGTIHPAVQEEGEHQLVRAARVARRKLLAARQWDLGSLLDQDSLNDFLDLVEATPWPTWQQAVAIAAWAEAESRKVARRVVTTEAVRYNAWLHEGAAGDWAGSTR